MAVFCILIHTATNLKKASIIIRQIIESQQSLVRHLFKFILAIKPTIPTISNACFTVALYLDETKGRIESIRNRRGETKERDKHFVFLACTPFARAPECVETGVEHEERVELVRTDIRRAIYVSNAYTIVNAV